MSSLYLYIPFVSWRRGVFDAALVASHMLLTFPNIRFGLMVGIGGGIPNHDRGEERDIQLRDVLISSDSKSGGLGKILGDGSFEVSYHLNRPPRLLRTAFNRLDSDHMTRDNYIADHIRTMLEKYPRMRKMGFAYPEHAGNLVFDADYRHVGGLTCAKCNPAKAVMSRPERRDTKPVIHYGIIATGSTVIKHAPTRQQIQQKHNAICVEMEAAGLMNHFPCLVIRGISHYADSHKDDGWQAYAAATAAAYAKELLEYVPVREVVGSMPAREVLAQGQ